MISLAVSLIVGIFLLWLVIRVWQFFFPSQEG